MKVHTTALPGVLLLEPRVFGDARGFFVESYRANDFQQLGIPPLVQDNHSRSGRGVLRGLHYQLVQPQGKLVRVVRGRIFDVAVDIRRGSAYFGRWFGVGLDDENLYQLYIPPGFAHGFCVLSEVADVIYKCTDYYHPASEYGIAWNDAAIDIDWPLTDCLVSAKDRAHPPLAAQPNLPSHEGTA